MEWPAPVRRRGHEILDGADVDPAVRLASLADVGRSNVLFGGRRAVLVAIAAPLDALDDPVTVLDVGTGLADVPAAIGRRFRRRRITLLGLDESTDLLEAARSRVTFAIGGSALALPFRDASVDIVLCSQLLHHFADADVDAALRELDRVARRGVVIADLRRSWLAAAGFWMAAVLLRFHRVTRHDGVVSVLRGFTAGELRRAVARATGREARVHHRLGFRLTATWAKPAPPTT